MGLVKFKGNVVYQGPLAAFNINNNWNNSMAEYYPFANIMFVDGMGGIRSQVLQVSDFYAPEQHKDFDVQLDQSQTDDMNRIIQARRDAEEAKVVRLYKEVTVVRGRKVPIGTQGRVFWMGDKGWGMSVGIEEASGKKHFTSLKNVETVDANKLFEDLILNSGSDDK